MSALKKPIKTYDVLTAKTKEERDTIRKMFKANALKEEKVCKECDKIPKDDTEQKWLLTHEYCKSCYNDIVLNLGCGKKIIQGLCGVANAWGTEYFCNACKRNIYKGDSLKDTMKNNKETNALNEERNININEAEMLDLKRALNCLIEEEQDQTDYTDLLNKLNCWYD